MKHKIFNTFVEKKRFNNRLRRYCWRHGLDYFEEKRKFEQWEKSERLITLTCWVALAICILLLASGR